jgi:hypothetical protein
MKEEFAETDGERSVEETVIAASINSIQGAQKHSVMHLFKALALIPEDTVVPLEIIAMMYESVPQTAGGPTKRPSVLNTYVSLYVCSVLPKPSLSSALRCFNFILRCIQAPLAKAACRSFSRAWHGRLHTAARHCPRVRNEAAFE